MDSEWTLVKGGRKGGSVKGTRKFEESTHAPRAAAGRSDELILVDKVRAGRLRETIDGMQKKLASSLVYQSTVAALDEASSLQGYRIKVGSMIIYGLGSVDDSITSRWQLALALLLRDLLASTTDSHLELSAYDPAFSPCDLLLMQTFGIGVIEENEQCKRFAPGPTLFYVPHCEHHLYESLVTHNLSSGTLANVIILGNSFKMYGESLNGSKPIRIMELVSQGRVSEIKVPCDPPSRSRLRDEGTAYPEGAFNNTSLHLFPSPCHHLQG